MASAKIKEVTEEHILFTDGTEITFCHEYDCCEENYADFNQLDDIARNIAFDTEHLVFEAVENAGFRFGNAGKMFFVPCYSEQNGFYTAEIDIYCNDEWVLRFDCEEIID